MSGPFDDALGGLKRYWGAITGSQPPVTLGEAMGGPTPTPEPPKEATIGPNTPAGINQMRLGEAGWDPEHFTDPSTNPLSRVYGGVRDIASRISEHPAVQALQAVTPFIKLNEFGERVPDIAARKANTQQFRDAMAGISPTFKSVGEDFAREEPGVYTGGRPRVAAIMKPYAAKAIKPPAGAPETSVTKGFAVTPWQKPGPEGVPVGITPSGIAEAEIQGPGKGLKLVKHEGTHVAQVTGDPDYKQLYNMAKGVVNYKDIPYEVSARGEMGTERYPYKTAVEGLKHIVKHTEENPHLYNEQQHQNAQDIKWMLKSRESMPSRMEMLGGPEAMAEPLDMSTEARMKRAEKQGYTLPVYHGTKAPEDFSEFAGPIQSKAGRDFGIHTTPEVGTAENVIQKLEWPEGGSPSREFEKGGRVMPLYARTQKVLEMPDVGMWHSPSHWVTTMAPRMGEPEYTPWGKTVRGSLPTNDMAVAQKIYDLARQHEKATGEASHIAAQRGNLQTQGFQSELKDLLQQHGYDTIKYPNTTEGKGEPSYLHLDPRSLKSRWAAFDPAKFGKTKDILAGLAGAIGIGKLAQETKKEEEK